MNTRQICIVTDIHVTAPGQLAMDIDTRKNFVDIINRVNSDPVEHLIICGDLCYREPREDVYVWVKGILDSTGIPYSLIAGNHDDSNWMASVFGLEKDYHSAADELYYIKEVSERNIMFLDTGKGFMSNEQYHWMINSLEQHPDIQIICMHHPPVFGGIPHMDAKYSFTQSDRFVQSLAPFDRLFTVFCGHYHVEKTIRYGNMEVFITPSCFVQIDYRYEEFIPEHTLISFRNIWIGEKYLSTSVHYITEV